MTLRNKMRIGGAWLAAAVIISGAFVNGAAMAHDDHDGMGPERRSDNDGMYVSGGLGATLTQTMDMSFPVIAIFPPPDVATGADMDNGGAASLALGVKRGHARLEVELLGQAFDVTVVGDPAYPILEGEFGALMGNAYYDFGDNGSFQPYVGLGIGVSEVDMGLINVEGRATYQAMAGAQFRLSQRMKLGVEYRYLKADMPAWAEDYKSSSVLAKLTYFFR